MDDSRLSREPSLREDDAAHRYRRLVESSHVGLFQTGRDGEIRWVNDAAAQIVGYASAEEFIRAVDDIRDIYVDPSRREDLEREADQRGSVTRFEYQIRRQDGSIRWISVNATATRSEDGSTDGYEGVVLDVTEAKLIQAAAEAISSELEPEESIRRFADVLYKVIPFQQLTLAVIEGDSYRRLVSISCDPTQEVLPTGEHVPLTGNSTAQAVSTRLPVVVQDTAQGLWEFDARLAELGIGSYATFPLMDGDEVFATFNIGVRATNGFTEKTVDSLSNHTSAVAQTVRNILAYERQREALQRLTELDRVKNEFFAEVAHDLRHPLTVVLGITQVLAKDWEGLGDGRKKELIHIAEKSAVRMLDLIQRDLDVALIESGQLSYEKEALDLAGVIEEATRSFAAAHPDRAVEVDVPKRLPLVFADPRRQTQILENLLSNAAKFSPEGSAIRISVERRDQYLNVSVSDEGEGITEEERGRLFQRLTRLERKTPGTGLGLYITRSMVEAQGGQIWVGSNTHKGATFTYSVPLMP